MLRNNRLVMYALLWAGISAGVYPLLPKLKNTPRPSNTTTVTPEADEPSKRVVLVTPTSSPKEEPVRPPSEAETTKPPERVEPKKQPEPLPTPETKKQPEPMKEAPKKQPEPMKVPEPKKEPLPEILIGKERRLDRPDGAYTVEQLVVRQKIKITGKVKTLTVNRIDGDSGLDASDLEAEEIIVLDRIDTRSRVRLLVATHGKVELRGKLDGDSHLEINAPNGTIEVRGKVDTRSRLTIHAENGRVTFTEPTMNGKEGSKIDGESKVSITAKEVEFHGKVNTRSRVEITAPDGRVTFAEPTTQGNEGTKIDGDAKVYITAKEVEFRGLICGNNTRAFVTLTKDSSLKFKEVDGGAFIGYKKAEASDPEPIIDAGRTTKKSQLRVID